MLNYSSEIEGSALTLYVDANAEGEGNGAKKSPYKTIEQAQENIRKLKAEGGLPTGGITVLVADGSYTPLTFTEEDSGTAECPITYVAENEFGAAIDGGRLLNPKDFEPINDGEKARIISEEAKDKIMKVDLKAYGLTAEDWGVIRPSGGTGSCLHLYDNVPEAYPCELSYDGKIMRLARYPNEGYAYTAGVVSHGNCPEYGPLMRKYDSYEGHISDCDGNYVPVRNPEPGIVLLKDETVERASHWQDLSDIWTFGVGQFSWARISNRAKNINLETKELTLEHITTYGLSRDCPYYFFNVFEELDEEGEYYVDRENGVLYLYADGNFDNAEISISCTPGNIITGTDLSHVTFKGFAVRGSRNYGISITGNNITADSLKVFNIRGYGINIKGNNVTVKNCELYNIGETALIVNGGDLATLTKSNNLICNNYVHDFGYALSATGIVAGGCGATICHNEICDSVHHGVTYGALSIFEYNELYNLCTESGDSGSVYMITRPDVCKVVAGSIARYNYIHDIGTVGSEVHSTETHGMFFDAPTSGWTVYCNVFENISGAGVKCGGGRDYVLENNVFINCHLTPYENNASLIAAFTSGKWNGEELGYVNSYVNVAGDALWTETFPYLKDIDATMAGKSYKDGYEDPNDPNLAVNAVGIVRNNIAYYSPDVEKKDYLLKENTLDILIPLGMFENNPIVRTFTDFTSYHNKDFAFKEDATVFDLIPDFKDIPFHEIGRNK